jgi:signal transduction histidine kinase
VSNAIKFSPAEAIVNVGMHRSETGQLVVTIRDAGIGISAEDAVRVFEPFVQIDGGSTRSYGGMGLGLSIARRIARLHGGDVTLEGLAGIGTEARLILPPERVVWPATQQSGSMVAA